LSVRRSRPTGDLLFCFAKKAGQKGEPAHGRAKIPRLLLGHPLKARSALFFRTNSTKRLPIIIGDNKKPILFQLFIFSVAANLLTRKLGKRLAARGLLATKLLKIRHKNISRQSGFSL
jgi:hypothetical protein